MGAIIGTSTTSALLLLMGAQTKLIEAPRDYLSVCFLQLTRVNCINEVTSGIRLTFMP
jgi:hypothetical protein